LDKRKEFKGKNLLETRKKGMKWLKEEVNG